MTTKEAINAIVTFHTPPPQIDYTMPYSLKAAAAEKFLVTLSEKEKDEVFTKVERQVHNYFDSGVAELDAMF